MASGLSSGLLFSIYFMWYSLADSDVCFDHNDFFGYFLFDLSLSIFHFEINISYFFLELMASVADWDFFSILCEVI